MKTVWEVLNWSHLILLFVFFFTRQALVFNAAKVSKRVFVVFTMVADGAIVVAR